MSEKTRNNHYVPQWYQKGFLDNDLNKLHVLDLTPPTKILEDGRIIRLNEYRKLGPTSNLFKKDLYSIFFKEYVNDDIETKLFGKIDDMGSNAVKSFIENDTLKWQENLFNLFEYINAQKIRTIKGLDWIKSHYPNLEQIDLMNEMIELRSINCTLWGECVKEIVSADKSEIKFITSDHPVTIFNYNCPPDNKYCIYPHDPAISFCGTQIIFPLDKNNCLILTHFEFANTPNKINPIKNRINAKNNRQSLIKTDNIIKNRTLKEKEVNAINYVIKKRAKQYICAAKKELLFPENIDANLKWEKIKDILLPSRHKIGMFGGKVFAGYDDGRTYYQDEYGRTTPGIEYLDKKVKKKIGNNDNCPCGSGKKFKKCCKNKKEEERPSWSTWSIRERNLTLINGIFDILGLNKGKNWIDVRKEISNEQIKKIYQLIKSLWSIDSDIIDLLPKSDESMRVLYSGIIHPDIVDEMTKLTIYFDEVLVESPFLNPNNLHKEYNPLDNPSQFKLNTLKNIQFLIRLIPFIENGSINLIPDITNFYPKLKKQVVKMAKERAIKNNIKLEHEELEWLHNEMTKEGLLLLDEESFIHQIKKTQKISKEENKDLREYYHKERLENPYIPLQDNIFNDGGQLNINKISPNYESSLLLSQITGSILITNNKYRWNEITYMQKNKTYNELLNEFNNAYCPFEIDTINILEKSKENIQKRYKNVLREVSTLIKNKNTDSKNLMQLKEKVSKINKEVKDNGSLIIKFDLIAPDDGIFDINVQRLILSIGTNNFNSNLPLAIYFKIESI